jgi:transcriptional regulator of acetoin/glycerol metabolism
MVTEAQAYLDSQLEDDVEIAARSRVPVLISASPDRALKIAREIADRAARAARNGATARMQICDSAAGDDIVAALTENRLKAAMGEGTTTFLLQEVHMLSEIEQEAIMRLLDTRPMRPLDETPRIITTSSISLFDRVKQGAFDARLFHRLNAIHIVASPDGG